MDDTASEVPPGWAEALHQSLAELAAGQTIPAATIHDELLLAIAVLEAALAAEDGVSVPPAPGP